MYSGLTETIEFGASGLRTDDPDTMLAKGDLRRAINVTFEGTKLSKAPGSHRFNKTSLGSAIVGVFDWFPDDITQRQIAITRDGYVWRLVDRASSSKITTADTTETQLMVGNQVCLTSGGNEAATFPRKLFILSGANTIQVISGDGITRHSMTKPSADWSGINQPFGSIIHRGRLWCWGNRNNPHGLYGSNPDDHEDFQTFGGASVQFQCYPGEFEKVLTCAVFKGQFMIFKYPRGIYYLDDSSSDYTQWQIIKVSDSFGAASIHSTAYVLDDMLVANAYGGVTSYNAANYYGGAQTSFDMADVLKNTRNFKYVAENMNPNGRLDRQAIYYDFKKQAFFSYRSTSSQKNDQLLCIDYSGPQQNPRVSWYDKDQPNCLYMKKDTNGIPRPAYGAEDGFIYLMDQEDRDVADQGYEGEWMTPFMDMKNPQIPGLDEMNKVFDFLQIDFENTGKWDLLVDVFIDGRFSETINFSMSTTRGTDQFILDYDRTYGAAPSSIRKPLHGSGKRIALRGYNSGAGQNFTVLKAIISFRPGTQGEKDDN